MAVVTSLVACWVESWMSDNLVDVAAARYEGDNAAVAGGCEAVALAGVQAGGAGQGGGERARAGCSSVKAGGSSSGAGDLAVPLLLGQQEDGDAASRAGCSSSSRGGAGSLAAPLLRGQQSREHCIRVWGPPHLTGPGRPGANGMAVASGRPGAGYSQDKGEGKGGQEAAAGPGGTGGAAKTAQGPGKEAGDDDKVRRGAPAWTNQLTVAVASFIHPSPISFSCHRLVVVWFPYSTV